MEFTWTSVLVALLNVLVGSLLVTIVRTRPALKKIANEREQSLLDARGEDMDAMRVRIESLETRLERKDAEHEATVAVLRHRLNNVTACFDALLLLIKTNPQKAAEAVVEIEAMRARQITAEAVEKGAIHAENIAQAETATVRPRKTAARGR